MQKCPLGFLAWLLLGPSLGWAAGTVTGYSRALPAGYEHSNERFNNYPGSLFGPRIAWAEPHVLGQLKLLIILPWGAAHEAVELRSRLPAEVNLITMAANDMWVNPGAGEPAYQPVPPEGTALSDTAHRLLSPGYRYDAIVIGKVRWSAIPPAIQEKVLEKVRGGTTLVWISPWDVGEDLRQQMGLSAADNPLWRSIQATVPLGLLPLEVDTEATSPQHFFPRRVGPLEVRTGKLGGGSVVWLDYQDRAIKPAHAQDTRTVHNVDPWRNYAATVALTPFLPLDDLHYDYYYSILGRVLYISTGKVTAAEVRATQPLVTLARQHLPAAPLSFTVRLAAPELRETSLRFEVRDHRGRVVHGGLAPDALGAGGSYAPPLPRLPQGTYVVDLWALQREAVLDWASAALTVTDTRYLQALEPAQEFFARGDSIRGTVKLREPLAAGLAASVEMWDTHDRLLAVAPLPPTGGEFAFPPVVAPLSRAYKLVGTVQEQGFVVDRAETWVGLPDNTVDDYQFIMWANALRTRANRTLMHQCKQHAVTGYYDLITWLQRELIFESADALAQNNLLANPYTCHLNLSIRPDRKYAATVQQQVDWLQKSLAAYRRYGVMAYSTVEECHISRGEGEWENPEAVQDYQAYLKEHYGTLARLNEVWGTQFKDFAEIAPVSLMEAKTTSQPTRWLAQERHKVERFNRVYEILYEQIQKADPGARMSFDCIGGMDFDWPRMSAIVTSYTQAPLEAFRKNQGNLVGTWIGYYLNENDEWTMRTVPWRYLFQGGTHVHWWPSAYAFTADLSEPMLCLQQAAEECHELQSGAGKLLLASRKRLDPILVLWSNTSYYAGILHPAEISWEAARQRFDNLLRHTGLDYQAVDAGFIERELAYGDRQRVLILPASQSLSRAGVAKIRAFAEAGGTVIADFPPAVVDEHLRPYGPPQAAGQVDFKTCARCKGAKRIEVGHVWQACPACGGTGQTMQGGVAPSHSLLGDVFDFSQQGARKVGRGYGLYLKGSPVRREEWGALRKVLVDHAGLQGDIEVQDPLGNLRTDIQSFVFDNGRAMLVGLIPDRALNSPPGENLVVKLSRPVHVYDVRRQQYLGETATVRTGILASEAKLLAFLPERIQGLNLSLSQAAGRPGEMLELRGALLPASLKDCRLVVHLEVLREGQVQEAYTQNLAFSGDFSHPLPLALNQAPGTYRVRVTEIISGHTQEVVFNVP
jgi:hypothetical protein